jgi:hypothetical protein
MVLSIEFIPDAWQSGWLNEIIMLGAVLGALLLIVRTVLVPVFRSLFRLARAFETAVDRLNDVPAHDDRLDVIEQAVEEIRDALRPTNGDRRSISDRLDTVKQQTVENSRQIVDLAGRVDAMVKEAT